LIVGKVPDTTAPIITRIGEPSLSIIQGSIYTDLGATALDDVDGDITSGIVINGVVNTAVPGTYTITYDVKDAAGNAAEQVTRIVTVEKKGDPTAMVEYSITSFTNQDVVATVTGFSEQVQNINEATHTFTDNGDFTFTFEDVYGNK
jgi:PKD repeat protein